MAAVAEHEGSCDSQEYAIIFIYLPYKRSLCLMFCLYIYCYRHLGLISFRRGEIHSSDRWERRKPWMMLKKWTTMKITDATQWSDLPRVVYLRSVGLEPRGNDSKFTQYEPRAVFHGQLLHVSRIIKRDKTVSSKAATIICMCVSFSVHNVSSYLSKQMGWFNACI